MDILHSLPFDWRSGCLPLFGDHVNSIVRVVSADAWISCIHCLPDAVLCPVRAVRGPNKRKSSGADDGSGTPESESARGGTPESEFQKGILATTYCKYIHAVIAGLRIVDGAAPGTPQLDFRTPGPAADTTVKKRCAFSESMLYASALSFFMHAGCFPDQTGACMDFGSSRCCTRLSIVSV